MTAEAPRAEVGNGIHWDTTAPTHATADEDLLDEPLSADDLSATLGLDEEPDHTLYLADSVLQGRALSISVPVSFVQACTFQMTVFGKVVV